MRRAWPALLSGFLLCVCCEAAAQPIPAGAGEQTIRLKDGRLTVFTYRPDCREPTLLFVFHGQGRNAKGYRNYARRLADEHCLLVVTPWFDEKEFPRWRYQQGGIVRRGEVRDPKDWTGRLVVDLVERIRRREGRDVAYSLLGHSAGGQFLSRLAAFIPTEAQRIVLANPGTLVFPDLDVKAPFGFGAVYPKEEGEQQLRRYLSLPLTIYLGRTTPMTRS